MDIYRDFMHVSVHNFREILLNKNIKNKSNLHKSIQIPRTIPMFLIFNFRKVNAFLNIFRSGEFRNTEIGRGRPGSARDSVTEVVYLFIKFCSVILLIE